MCMYIYVYIYTHFLCKVGLKHSITIFDDLYLFKGTYFQVDGVDEVALTTRGTRPGDPVGDILFNMVMGLILQDVTNTLQEQTPAKWQGDATPVSDLSEVHPVPDHAWCEVAFVDDLAILLRAPSQQGLYDLALQAFAAIEGAANKRGLKLNSLLLSLEQGLEHSGMRWHRKGSPLRCQQMEGSRSSELSWPINILAVGCMPMPNPNTLFESAFELPSRHGVL